MEMKYRLLTLSEGGIAMTIGTGYDVYQNYNSGVSRIPTDPDEEKKAGRRSSPQDCETCKKRKYQDGSDEGNVSFKTASHISPEAAGSAVRAHENEHVNNAYNKASEGNGEVLSATVSIHTSICPECGRSYISGGTTNTMIKYTNESNPYQQELKSADATLLRGANLDLSA
jgi:hypothetical protein